MKLWSYWRSSCSYRVRIALNLKGLSHDQVAVHLTRAGGEQHREGYRSINPHGLLPALAPDGGPVLTQSMAIVEYLDERFPEPPLLPSNALDRARVRALAHTIAADVQPLQNLRVLQLLRSQHGLDQQQIGSWVRHWIATGFASVEEQLPSKALFVAGSAPGLAEVVLVPQMYNARRFGVDLSAFPNLCAIDAACRALPAFALAAPEAQADAVA